VLCKSQESNSRLTDRKKKLRDTRQNSGGGRGLKDEEGRSEL